MKTISRMLLTMTISGLCHAQMFERASYAFSGDRGGNGGNSIASHFTTIGKNVSKVLDSICSDKNESEDVICEINKDFQAQLYKADTNKQFVTVLGEETVYAYDCNERDAVNYLKGVYQHPCNQDTVLTFKNNTILVGETRWKNMTGYSYHYYYNSNSTTDRRIKLVLHEYISLLEKEYDPSLGIETSDYYPYSDMIYTLLSRKNINLDKLASNETVPDYNTIYVGTDASVDPTIHRKIISHLESLNYVSVDDAKAARFSLSSRVKCDGRHCNVVTELVDNYKKEADKLVNSEWVADKKPFFTNKKSFLEELFIRALKSVKKL